MERHHKNKVSDCSALKITTNIPMTLIDTQWSQKEKELKKRKKLKLERSGRKHFQFQFGTSRVGSSEIALPDLNFEANLPKSRGESFKF